MSESTVPPLHPAKEFAGSFVRHWSQNSFGFSTVQIDNGWLVFRRGGMCEVLHAGLCEVTVGHNWLSSRYWLLFEGPDGAVMDGRWFIPYRPRRLLGALSDCGATVSPLRVR